MAWPFPPVATLFVLVIFTGIVVVVISKALDHLWARVLSAGRVYYGITIPGIVIHECAHMLGCFITGARVKKIVFFSRDGGSVTHGPPALPLLGNIIISTAPLFFIPLVLAGLIWLFCTYAGCSLSFSIFPIESAGTAISLVTGSVFILWENLVVRFNAWFLLYLYLVLSLILSLAPSMQDMKNAAAGLMILTGAGLLVIWSNMGMVVPLFSTLLQFIATGLALGLVFEILAVLVSLPALVAFSLKEG
jgi:hypothetical protein